MATSACPADAVRLEHWRRSSQRQSPSCEWSNRIRSWVAWFKFRSIRPICPILGRKWLKSCGRYKRCRFTRFGATKADRDLASPTGPKSRPKYLWRRLLPGCHEARQHMHEALRSKNHLVIAGSLSLPHGEPPERCREFAAQRHDCAPLDGLQRAYRSEPRHQEEAQREAPGRPQIPTYHAPECQQSPHAWVAASPPSQ